MSRVDGPPVVNQNVEDGEENDEECRGPSGFEAYCDHDAGGKTHNRHDDTCKGPLALEDDTNEEEYKKHAARQLEAVREFVSPEVISQMYQQLRLTTSGDRRH